MITVDDYGRIRRAHRDGLSIRVIARSVHYLRQKIREHPGLPRAQALPGQAIADG